MGNPPHRFDVAMIFAPARSALVVLESFSGVTTAKDCLAERYRIKGNLEEVV
jgi:hypothetical protein